MRKAIFIIVALFSMSVFSSCDEPEFTTSDSETVIKQRYESHRHRQHQ